MTKAALDKILLAIQQTYGQSLDQARRDIDLLMDSKTRASLLIQPLGTDYVQVTIDMHGSWCKTYTLKA
jgi:hypothetical protein